MNPRRRTAAVLMLIALLPTAACESTREQLEPQQPFTRDERAEQPEIEWNDRAVERALVLVADWALANPAPFDVRDWPMAGLYDGLIDASLVTGDPKYLAAVIRAGRRSLFVTRARSHHEGGHAAG